jgi:hypothetical protein
MSDSGEEEEMTRGDDRDIPVDLLRAAAAAAAPTLTPVALRERFGPPGDWRILPGQLWRAASDDVTMLVLIVSVSEEAVTAAPATVEPAAEAEGSLIVDAGRTALDVPVTIWSGLMRQLRLELLDSPIDEIGTDVAKWCATGLSVPSGCRLGSALTSPFEMDTDVGAMVADDIDFFANVQAWAIDLDAAQAPSAAVVPAPSRDQFLKLQSRLGLALPDVLALVDGKRPAAAEEATALREVLGYVPRADPPARGLVIELSHPRWRPAARAFARRTSRSEPEARLTMAYEIGGASMAARQTGEREPAWHDRVQRWVTAHGLEDSS